MIEESVKNAQHGVDISNEVAKILDEIAVGIGKTSDLVGEIAGASSEQAEGISQVNTAVAQMDKVTQQNAANAEESASASEELSAQAEQMNSALAALVGGSCDSVGTGHLSISDGAFHRISEGRGGRSATRVLPLTDDVDTGGSVI